MASSTARPRCRRSAGATIGNQASRWPTVERGAADVQSRFMACLSRGVRFVFETRECFRVDEPREPVIIGGVRPARSRASSRSSDRVDGNATGRSAGEFPQPGVLPRAVVRDNRAVSAPRPRLGVIAGASSSLSAGGTAAGPPCCGASSFALSSSSCGRFNRARPSLAVMIGRPTSTPSEAACCSKLPRSFSLMLNST